MIVDFGDWLIFSGSMGFLDSAAHVGFLELRFDSDSFHNDDLIVLSIQQSNTAEGSSAANPTIQQSNQSNQSNNPINPTIQQSNNPINPTIQQSNNPTIH